MSQNDKVLDEYEVEPNESWWKHEPSGLFCVIRRHPSMKHLCGYVSFPRSLSGEEENSISVHGGVTFNGKNEFCDALVSEEQPNWVGFDCAHYMDYIPQMRALGLSAPGTYKNWAYVKEELNSLAGQLKAILDSKLLTTGTPNVIE